ncbi:MAG: FixH family protein, partial [Acidobacteriota bacterium]
TFRKPGGDPVEIENVNVEFYMPAMAAMPAMLIGAEITPIAPNAIEGNVDLSMSGEWQMRITFDTPAESTTSAGSATPAGSRNARISISTQ